MTLNAYLPASFVMLNIHISTNASFMLDEMFQLKTSKFSIFLKYENSYHVHTKNMAKFEIFSWNHFIKHKSLTILTNCTFSSHLFLKLFLCKEGKFISKDFLRIEHLLIVHLFDKRMIFNAIGFQKFHVGYLESLPNWLSNELSLKWRKLVSQTSSGTEGGETMEP